MERHYEIIFSDDFSIIILDWKWSEKRNNFTLIFI